MSERLYWDSGAPIKIVDKGGEMSLTLYRSDCGHFFTFSDGIEHPPCPICYELKQYYQLLSQAKKQIEADEHEINELRNGSIAEYELRVRAEQTLHQMLDELKAVDMGDSETRIRIYHVLNKYNML